MHNFIFTVNESEANTILQMLAKAPYEMVFQLVAKLQRQAAEQSGNRSAAEIPNP